MPLPYLTVIIDPDDVSSDDPEADEELTVSTIDRVVQNALVQPDLYVLHREEQGTVGEDADLMLGGFEEPRPDLAGNRPPMRIDGRPVLAVASAL